ncbi:hypothetical protein ACHQM5_000452 [Ranunculus cassubicifolius]
MARHGHHHQGGFCTTAVFRLVMFLMSLLLVGFFLGPPLFRHLTGRRIGSSCPPCLCDCSPSDTFVSLSLDCGKDDPEMSIELRKNIIELLKEELSLQKIVTHDTLVHTKSTILDARKTSSQYQKEAEKCTTGVETCEQAREKAEAELREERKQTELWEERAREYGWRDLRRRAYI